MVVILLLQDGVEKEPTTWRFVLNRPPSSSLGYKEESGSLHTPRLTQRLEKQGRGEEGRTESERGKDGQESESSIWCRAPQGALLIHVQRFQSPAPSWLTLKQIPASYSALSRGSREIHRAKSHPTTKAIREA